MSISQETDILEALLFSPETSKEYHMAKQQWPNIPLETKISYLPRLRETLKHTELLPRKNAVWAIASLKEYSKPALPELLPMLQDKEISVRREVIVALGQIGDPQSIERLLPFLGDKDILTQKQTLTSLFQLGFNQENARDILIQALHHKEWKIRQGVSLVLGEIAKQDSFLFSKLLAKLQDPDPEIRFVIIRIFSITKLLEKEVIEALFQGLKDPVEKVSHEAMLAIYSIQAKKANSALALPPLKEMLLSENKLWKYVAAHVLSTFPEEANQIIPLLISGTQDPDEKIRALSVIALGIASNNSPEIIVTLKKTLKDPNKEIRQKTLQAFQNKGTLAREAIPEITETIQDPDPLVRLYARQLLQKIQESIQENNATEKKEK